MDGITRFQVVDDLFPQCLASGGKGTTGNVTLPNLFSLDQLDHLVIVSTLDDHRSLRAIQNWTRGNAMVNTTPGCFENCERLGEPYRDDRVVVSVAIKAGKVGFDPKSSDSRLSDIPARQARPVAAVVE